MRNFENVCRCAFSIKKRIRDFVMYGLFLNLIDRQ